MRSDFPNFFIARNWSHFAGNFQFTCYWLPCACRQTAQKYPQWNIFAVWKT